MKFDEVINILNIEECDVVKRNRFNAAPEIHNGKCLGYGHYGDEPIEECQNCRLYESYGVE